MNVAQLLRRRFRAHAGLLLIVLTLTAIATAAVAGSIGYLTVASRDGVRDALREASPQEAAVEIRTRLADDPAAQTDAADAVLHAHLDGLPLTVHPSARTVAVAASTPDGTPLADVVLGAQPDFVEQVRLVAGTWPTTPPDAAAADAAATDAAAQPTDSTTTPAALQAQAAEQLGLQVGDRLVVDDAVTLEVVALWEPDDRTDPAWFADPLVLDGVDDLNGLRYGPFMVAEDALTDLTDDTGVTTLVRWTIVPQIERVEPGDVPTLREAVAATIEALDDDAVKHQGMAADGDLVATLASIEGALAASRGVTTSAILLVVLAAVAALGQAARLLGTVRTAELEVLRSRGTSVAQVATASGAEGAVVGLLGAALGVAAVLVAGMGTQPGPQWWTAGAAALGTTAVLTVVAGAQARAAAARGRSDVAGRRAVAIARWLPPVVAVAAGLAYWQLVRFGSPAFVGTDGRMHLDPVAPAAVPLALVAVALLVAGAVPMVTRAGAAWSQRSVGVVRTLTLRQVSRQAGMHAVPALLVALVAASAVFVATYAGSWQSYRTTVAHAEVGADLRVDLGVIDPVAPGGAPVAAELRALPGVSAAVPARVGPFFLSGSVGGTLVAVPAGALGDVVQVPDGAAAGGPARRLGLGAGAQPREAAGTGSASADPATAELAVAVESAEDVPVEARVWWADGAEDLALVDAGTAEPGPDGTVRWDVPLPDFPGADDAGWRMVAVDLLPAEAVPMDLTVLAPEATWTGLAFGRAGPLELEADDGAVVLDEFAVGAQQDEARGGRTVRLLPGPAPAAVPIVVTRAWQNEHGLDTGATTRLRWAGRTLDVQVVAATTVVPGAADAEIAALADLGALNDALLRAAIEVPGVRQVWGTAEDPAEVAGVVGTTWPSATVTTALPAAQRVAPAVVVFWIAASAVLLLAAAGLAAAVLAVAATRRSELAVLRALGVGPGQQARLRRAELLGVAGGALVLGAVGGLGVAWLCAGILVRAGQGTTGVIPVALAPDLLGGGALLAAACAVVGGLAGGYGSAVRREAARATAHQVVAG